MERLDNLSLLNDTLCIFTADHGEFLGEHGRWLHGLPGFTQVLHVPLIMVYSKGIPARKKITQNVQLLDIMPTILDFAHISKKDMLLQGHSLFPLIKDENVGYLNRSISYTDGKIGSHGPCFFGSYPHASVFFNNFNLLKSLINKKNVANFFRVFDFFLDPQEEHNLAGDDPEDSRINSRLTDFMLAFKESNAKVWEIITKRQEEESAYSQTEIENLISLGYLQ
jgi:arylsulfatase A-like enzyme